MPSVHGALEQDRGKNTRPGKAGAGYDARAHLVHQRKHLLFVRPGTLLDPVTQPAPWGAATTLVERGNEAGLRPDL